MFSILFSEPVTCNTEEPSCFRDLNLDQLLDPVIRNENRIGLAPLFYTPLSRAEQVRFRQDIQRDLLQKENLSQLDSFSRKLCALADLEEKACQDLHSADPWRCHYLLYGHILDNSEQYVRAVTELCGSLPEMELRSQGLQQAAALVEELVHSTFFTELSRSQASLRSQFSSLTYLLHIRYGTLRVKQYEGEEDLSEKISSVFQKFRSEQHHDYRRVLKEEPYADHVEAAILQCLSRIYPREFEALSDYVKTYSDFINRDLLTFCREIRFYTDWLLAIRPMRDCGLPFCFPELCREGAYGTDLYDLTLAERIGSAVVKNDFERKPEEKILVVTGPNQGGKTTFARALGQLHYLTSLGLCVPGRSAVLPLTDRVLTHFGREKAELQGSGRLQDDLQRLHGILNCASDRSFLVINEIFASTSGGDGADLGRKMIDGILEKGSTAVVVTFLSELADCRPETVSMISTVDPEAPGQRTFRILRRPPDELTYAMTLARKYRLTCDQVIRRIGK